MIETYIKRDKFNRMTVCTGTNRDDLLEWSERLKRTGKGAAQGTPAGNQRRENGNHYSMERGCVNVKRGFYPG